MSQGKIKLFYKLSLLIFKVIFTIFNDDMYVYSYTLLIEMYTHKASPKMKNTKVQRAMEKILGIKENIGLQMPGS